jgi:hypothetical protein
LTLKKPILLVGDNPFHGISHLSQEQSRVRNAKIKDVDYASNLVTTSLKNGAGGFMFTVSETTLSILKEVTKKDRDSQLELYAIVPYAYEYVRLATQLGGVMGIARKIGKEMITSLNFSAIAMSVKGLSLLDVKALMKAYLLYEISKIKSVSGKQANLVSVILHEIITEMALALDWDWFFKSYVDFLSKRGIKPGFETRNFAFFVKKFRAWEIDHQKILVTTPFNKIGFQMNPSKSECEKALKMVSDLEIIAMSVLAAGYLKPAEAVEYVKSLPNISGIVLGVSREKHAQESFKLFNAAFETLP